MVARRIISVWRKVLPDQPTRIVILIVALVVLIVVEATFIFVSIRRNSTSNEPIVTKNIAYCTDASSDRQLDLYVPARARTNSFPVVVYIHGGGWWGGHRGNNLITHYREIFLQQGVAVADVGYRLKSESRYPDQNDDVACALHHLAKYQSAYNLDMSRYVLFGDSAGGQLAAVAALSVESARYPYPRPRGVIDFYGVTDFTAIVASKRPDMNARRYLGKSYAQNAIKASPITMVTSSAPPFLIVHGARDGVVPISQSKTFAKRLDDAGAEVELYIVPAARHGFIGPELDQEAYEDLRASVTTFLSKTIAK